MYGQKEAAEDSSTVGSKAHREGGDVQCWTWQGSGVTFTFVNDRTLVPTAPALLAYPIDVCPNDGTYLDCLEVRTAALYLRPMSNLVVQHWVSVEQGKHPGNIPRPQTWPSWKLSKVDGHSCFSSHRITASRRSYSSSLPGSPVPPLRLLAPMNTEATHITPWVTNRKHRKSTAPETPCLPF